MATGATASTSQSTASVAAGRAVWPAGASRCQWEELRIALVMNGGVSLAVWMGGVSNEIFRLVTLGHPVYRGLLHLTRSSVRIDAISGTSAGGVNGAALSIALLYGGDFSCLRKTWLNTGTFADLLRSPTSDNPGSLLDGDSYFLPAIERSFAMLASAAQPIFTADQMPIDLKLTATLLSGYQGRNVDALGAPVHDVNYRAFFHFLRTGASPAAVTGPSSAPARPVFDNRERMIACLAKAARSTASFPFAFEPSMVSRSLGGAYLTNYEGADLSRTRYVVDGGVLNNKPFRGAREAIFGMPRHFGVRRVMAYVNPDPGDGPEFKPEGKPRMPSLAEVVAASVIGIPQSQSIADELQEIERHNLEVRRRRDSVLTLARASANDVDALEPIARRLFDVYRSRRLDTTFELFVLQPLSRACAGASELTQALARIGKNGNEALRKDFAQLPHAWIPASFPARDDHANDCDATWEWGLFPVEFASKVMLNLLRLIQPLADMSVIPQAGYEDTRELLSPSTASDWEDRDAMPWDPSAVVRHNEFAESTVTHLGGRLSVWWKEAFEIVARIQALRADERKFWRESTQEAVRDLRALGDEASKQEKLHAWHRKAVEALFGRINGATRRAASATLAYDIAKLIREAAAAALDGLQTIDDGRAKDDSDKLALSSLARVLSHRNEPRDTVLVLLWMEVIEFAFTDHDALNTDASIELVQISGNHRSPLGGPEIAKSKLLGLQLAHFGAFYKESWRANDWTYGRLDGSGRLVDILLSPNRLYKVYRGEADLALERIRYIALDGVPSATLRLFLARQWQKLGLEKKLRAELEFLMHSPGAPLPDSLPRAAEAVKLRLHAGILRDELKEIGLAAANDISNGADELWAGHALAERVRHAAGSARPEVFTPDEAKRCLEEGLLAGDRAESFAKEAGSDLFTRTLAHTIATTQNTLASKAAKLGPISVLFASLWLPLVGFHFVARVLTKSSRSAAAVHGAMLAVGIAIVILSLVAGEDGKKAFGTSVVTFGWLMLAFGLVMSIVRSATLLILLAGISGVALLALSVSYVPNLWIFGVVVLAVTLAWIFKRWQVLIALFVVLAAAWYANDLARGNAPAANLGRVLSHPADHAVILLGVAVSLALVLAWLQSSPLPLRWRAAREKARTLFKTRGGFSATARATSASLPASRDESNAARNEPYDVAPSHPARPAAPPIDSGT